MAFEEPSTFVDEPRDIRGRRAAVLAGVALVWAAFMASLGLLLLALVVLLAGALGAAWLLGLRPPRHDALSSARATGRRVSLAIAERLRAAREGRTKQLARAAVLAGRALERSRREPGWRRRDSRIAEALASNSQGIALARAGKPAEAIDAFDHALSLLAETGDHHHEGQVLANLGVVHHQVGGDEAARFCWTKALERLEPGTPESERTAELLGAR